VLLVPSPQKDDIKLAVKRREVIARGARLVMIAIKDPLFSRSAYLPYAMR